MASRDLGCITRALLISVCVALFAGCGMDGEQPENGIGTDNNGVDREDERVIESRPAAALFAGSELITILRPHRCEHIVQPLGELTLRWEPSGEARVLVALMAARPRYDQDGLKNVDDIVWVWTTSAGRGDGGYVTWAEGSTPHPETGLPDGPAPSMAGISSALVESDVFHLWMVTWAWDEDRKLSHASEERPFFFTPTYEEPFYSSLDSEDACNLAGIGARESDEEPQHRADARWYCLWCRPLSTDSEADHERLYGCRSRVAWCDLEETG